VQRALLALLDKLVYKVFKEYKAFKGLQVQLDKRAHKASRVFKVLQGSLALQGLRVKLGLRVYKVFRVYKAQLVLQGPLDKLERRASKEYRALQGQREVLGQREPHPQFLAPLGQLELQVRLGRKDLRATLALQALVEPLDTMVLSMIQLPKQTRELQRLIISVTILQISH
jgi:hypothetical protein